MLNIKYKISATLHELIFHHNMIEIKDWVRSHPESVNSLSSAGVSALDAAIEANNPDIVRFLLENGANPNEWGGGNCSPLHLAIDGASDALLNTPMDADPPSMEVVKVLLEFGADPEGLDSRGRTALDFAAKYYPPAYNLLLEQLSSDSNS